MDRARLAERLEAWLDHLDATGRWALLKLLTGGLRVGVSARLARTAVAALGGRDVGEVEEVWHGLRLPYRELFAWLEERGPRPDVGGAPVFRPPMLANPIEAAGLDRTWISPSSPSSGSGTAFASTCGGPRRGSPLFAAPGDDIGQSSRTPRTCALRCRARWRTAGRARGSSSTVQRSAAAPQSTAGDQADAGGIPGPYPLLRRAADRWRGFARVAVHRAPQAAGGLA